MSHLGLIAFILGLALMTPVPGISEEMGAPAINMVEVEKTATAIENHLEALTILIQQQDVELEVLLDQVDETKDTVRKDSMQISADKLTRALDKLETVKAELLTKLNTLKALIDRSKEP